MDSSQAGRKPANRVVRIGRQHDDVARLQGNAKNSVDGGHARSKCHSLAAAFENGQRLFPGGPCRVVEAAVGERMLGRIAGRREGRRELRSREKHAGLGFLPVARVHDLECLDARLRLTHACPHQPGYVRDLFAAAPQRPAR